MNKPMLVDSIYRAPSTHAKPRKRQVAQWIGLSLALFLLACSTLVAQSGGEGAIQGTVTDATGAVCVPDNGTSIHFQVSGPAVIVGPDTVSVRGGIATVLIRSAGFTPGKITIQASAKNLSPASIGLHSK